MVLNAEELKDKLCDKNEMSLVGPILSLPKEVMKFEDWNFKYSN